MGILASTEVVEVSASELTAQYVGQTGPKTQRLLQKALGKVLFIDEAYRLAEGPYAKEAIDELVACSTNLEFAKKMIIILAGYDHDMERLMGINAGLRSRFAESIPFRSFEPQDCLKLLVERLTGDSLLDVSSLQNPSESFQREAMAKFEVLIKLGEWANARDVESLAKGIARDQLSSADADPGTTLAVTEQDVLSALNQAIQQRQQRVVIPSNTELGAEFSLQMASQVPDAPRMRAPVQRQTVTTAQPAEEEEVNEEAVEKVAQETAANYRDAGVSDEVWARLEIDKKKALEAEEHYHDTVARLRAAEEEDAKTLQQQMQDMLKLKGSSSKDAEMRLKLEQERLAHEIARRQRDEELEALERKRREEVRAQKKLRQMGVCVAGFQWIKQASGYRCAGGSHFVSNEALK